MKLNELFFSKERNYWFPIIGSSLIHWSLGFAYTLGNIIPYISSYMSLKGGNNVSIGRLCWIEGIFVLFQGGSNYLFPKISESFDYNGCLLIGMFSCCSGLFLCYLFLDSFFLYIFAYSIIYGIGHGILYASTLEIISNFYEKKLGPNMIGVLWLFRGMSMATLPSVQSSFVNPKNIYQNYTLNNDQLYASLTILEKLPKLIQLTLILSLTFQLIGVIILIKGIRKKTIKGEKKISKIDLSFPNEIINTESFKLLWLITFFTWPCIEYIQVYWKIHGIINTKLKDQQLSKISCLILVIHIFCRLFWGVFGEIAGHFNCICILSTMLASGLIMLMFPLLEMTSTIQYISGYILISVAHSGTSVVFPSIVAKKFGSSRFLIVFLLLFVAKASSCILFCTITELATNYLNIQYSLIPLLIFSIASFFLSFILKDFGINVKPSQELV